MKLLTLNTHSWLEEAPYQKLDTLCQQIVQAGYELICLQEINQVIEEEVAESVLDDYYLTSQSPVPIKADNFALKLIQALQAKGVHYYWTWAPAHVGFDKYDEGLAILAKKPFTPRWIELSHDFPYETFRRRIALEARFDDQAQKFCLYSVHHSWWKTYFRTEWDVLVKELKQARDATYQVIVAGDFNIVADDSFEGYQYIQQTVPFLKDAYKVAQKVSGSVATTEAQIDGWRHSKTGHRIDYFWLDQGLTVKSYRTVFDGEHTPLVSDHYGVEVAIE